MTFNDFVHKHNLKNRAMSNIKIYKVLKNIGLDSKMRIYLRDGKYPTNYGIVNLHPSKGTHWVCDIKDFNFQSYGCPLPEKHPNLIKIDRKVVFILEITFKKMIVSVVAIVYK